MNGLILGLSLMLSSAEEACLFEQAMNQFKAANYEAASKQFMKCDVKNEYKKEAVFFLGISFRHLGNHLEAIKQLKRAQVLDPSNVNASNELAVTYEQSKLLLKAQEVYEDVLTRKPKNFAARLGKARMLHWRGKVNEAIEQYKNILLDESDNIAVKLGLGFALISDYELIEAKVKFNAVLSHDKGNESANAGLAMLEKITKNKLRVKHQFSSEQRTQVKSTSFYYQHQNGYKSSWGASYLYNNLGLNPIPESGIRENRAIDKELALFTNYNFTPKFNGMFKVAERSRSDKNDILKYQYELGYRFNESLSGHFGQISEWSNKKLLNNLTFAGAEYTKFGSYSLSAQMYFSSDEDFGDSHSVSLKYKKYFSERMWGQVGLSQRFAATEKATTVFGKYSWQYNERTSVFVDAVGNLNDEQSTLGLGINYAF